MREALFIGLYVVATIVGNLPATMRPGARVKLRTVVRPMARTRRERRMRIAAAVTRYA